jgi:ankyrin repeat protein
MKFKHLSFSLIFCNVLYTSQTPQSSFEPVRKPCSYEIVTVCFSRQPHEHQKIIVGELWETIMTQKTPTATINHLIQEGYFNVKNYFRHTVHQYKLNLNAQDLEGNTLMHFAVTYNRPDVVELLLARNVNLKLKNIRGNTAEKLAHEYHQEKIAELLRTTQQNRPTQNIEMLSTE